tara:strand:+ start:369 stop:674 length:306 start_codon:yes stop_codon:yes gene_type:complete
MIVLKKNIATTFAVHLAQEASTYDLKHTSYETSAQGTIEITPTTTYNNRSVSFSVNTAIEPGLYLFEFYKESTKLCTHLGYITDETAGDTLGMNAITYYDA